MPKPNPHSSLVGRAVANLIAVVAVTAIFGLKTHIDTAHRHAEAEKFAARQAAVVAYDPYFTEQP
ncbi:MAG: hypothetical protein ABL957_07355 [Parvularculaceae bacterium]